MPEKIIIKNRNFTLTINERCVSESLIINDTKEECLFNDENLPLFAITERRPFNNEIKLAHPNKRTVFQANRVRRENNTLIVGFELIQFEAVIEIITADDYVAFSLKDFIVPEGAFGLGTLEIPVPAAEVRLLQLPIKNKPRFGEWSNIMWDEKSAVGIMGANCFTIIDNEKRKNFRILYADALQEVKLKGTCAAVIACKKEKLFSCIDSFEKDFDLPRGIESRNNKRALNASVLWTNEITPENADEIISYAKRGGFTKILIYYSAFIKEGDGYAKNGDYDFNERYPAAIDDLKKVLDKIKSAGINPGIHFLQTHIGIKSRYITPLADHRLNLTRYFTLSKKLSDTDTVIYVEQNPAGVPETGKLKILKFGSEIISYEKAVTTPPYCFAGCERGYFETLAKPHEIGTIGGVLDVSEFGATSVYIDQRTGLQDEIAAKLATIYNEAGFEFAYFDGSEGTNPPFEVYIPYAQYRVYKLFNRAPLFCEGAAKAHFSWHMLSGGNAFDVFPTDVFKQAIAKYPLEEARRTANDFTRVNFGWWRYGKDTMPDILEYGTSKAAAADCPATIISDIDDFKTNKRTADNLEVMRRWEYVREHNLLSDEQKTMLADANREFTLLINEKGEYELAEYSKIQTPTTISAFLFKRGEKKYVTFWHKLDSAKLRIAFEKSRLTLKKDLFLPTCDLICNDTNVVIIPVADKAYLECDYTAEEIKQAFEKATIV